MMMMIPMVVDKTSEVASSILAARFSFCFRSALVHCACLSMYRCHFSAVDVPVVVDESEDFRDVPVLVRCFGFNLYVSECVSQHNWAEGRTGVEENDRENKREDTPHRVLN
jgi:hypothetical protein